MSVVIVWEATGRVAAAKPTPVPRVVEPPTARKVTQEPRDIAANLIDSYQALWRQPFDGSAAPKSIELPAETAKLKASDLPGYAKAQTRCVACHSAEYMLYQPPTAPRTYWDAMVKRMKAVFKAPIDDTDMPDIVDYLVRTYGNEQPK